MKIASHLLASGALSLLVGLLGGPGGKPLVECQLEAVGAVLSVVPVTSILATAGLVGVKLAALSRLLDILGYDRAYLAQGGKGTAAHPIGLQTNYAYMFPYVPGLNISVSGDHRIGLPAAGVAAPAEAKGAAEGQLQPAAGHRKTYPAMGLPGDYEAQRRPFRGSETLRDIFQQAGVQLRLPTAQQRQQLQQQLNIPPQGNATPAKLVAPQAAAHTPALAHAPSPPNAAPATTSQAASVRQQPYQQSPPAAHQPLESKPTDNVQSIDHQNTNDHVPRQPLANANNAHHQLTPPIPSNVAHLNPNPNHNENNNNNNNNDNNNNDNNADHKQPASMHSSSSSPHRQGERQQQQQQQPASSNGEHRLALMPQVNMPHPHYNRQHQVFSRPSSASDPTAGVRAPQPQPQPFHPIPQHQEFHRRLSELRLRQQQQAPSATADPLPTGQLTRLPHEPALPPPKPLQTFDDYAKYFFGPQSATGAPAASAVPQSLRPHSQRSQQQQQQQRPPPVLFPPTPAATNFASGAASPGEEFATTNFLPHPFDSDDLPSTLSTDDNELDRTQHTGRRRKRAALTGGQQQQQQEAAKTTQTLSLPRADAERVESGAVTPNFGMPAMNIHSVRRRRRRRRSLGHLLAR